MATPAVCTGLMAVTPGAAASLAGPDARRRVPLSIWSAIPEPGRCPASAEPVPCPRCYTAAAAAAVIAALSRPGDLVAIPGPGEGAFLAGAAQAGRCAVGASRGAGRAALAIITCCPVPGCTPSGSAGNAGTADADAARADPELLFGVCQRALRPGGLLAVVTTTARHPGWAGEVTAHARAAGLIYAQHIIALHAPISGDRLLSPWPQRGGRAAASHLPAHTDLLLLTQPGGPRHA